MKNLAIPLVRNMASFRVEKTLRVGGPKAGGECRLADINLSVPSSSTSNVTGDSKNSGTIPNGTNETFNYKTPMYLIHTTSGTVPHITPDVLNLIYPTASSRSSECSSIPPLQISIDSTIKFMEPLQKFGLHIGKFVGLPEVPTFLTVHDSLQMLRSGHNDKFGIAMWSRHGRTSLTPERFAQTLSCYKPSLCQIMSDYDVNAESSGLKRLNKSLSRAEEYTNFVVKEKEKLASKLTHTPGLFITVESVWFEINEELAKKTVTNLLESQHQVEGIIIAGLVDRFAKSGPIVNDSDSRRAGEPSKVKTPRDVNLDLVERIIKTLPPGLPKYVPGPFQLSQIVSLISKGVDMLDSSIASKMAEQAEVFLLDEVEANMASLSLSAQCVRQNGNETLPERNIENIADETTLCSTTKESSVITMKEKQFFDDFRPLSKTCICYTCRKHTRSYVHHLYATDELLGPVLVQIHNLTALDRLFHIIRGILQDSDTPESLHERLTKLQNLLSNPSVSSDDITTRDKKMVNGDSVHVKQ